MCRLQGFLVPREAGSDLAAADTPGPDPGMAYVDGPAGAASAKRRLTKLEPASP
jgi:hypothetical protein